jgi:hypothetical protein
MKLGNMQRIKLSIIISLKRSHETREIEYSSNFKPVKLELLFKCCPNTHIQQLVTSVHCVHIFHINCINIEKQACMCFPSVFGPTDVGIPGGVCCVIICNVYDIQ